MSTGTRWTLAAVLAVAVASAAVAAVVLTRPGEAPLLNVYVTGRNVELPAGATLGRAIRDLGLQPQPGRLLDVRGRALRRGAFPGAILVNGRTSAPTLELHDGDRVTLRSGRDRTEPLERTTERVKNGLLGNPQYTVARAPGEELIVRGAISHELVSTRFRAVGSARPERAVALTFDDGPSPAFTPRILRTLKRLHVRATFFVIGYLAEAYPNLVRAEQRLGMAIGNHTYNHPEVPPFAQLPPLLIRDEIFLTADVLARLGIRTDLFRPPAGSFSGSVERVASRLGERIVLWSVDPPDWAPGSTAREIARRVLAAVRPGSIVILHDGGGDRSATLAALPLIVHGIEHRHLHLVTLDEAP